MKVFPKITKTQLAVLMLSLIIFLVSLTQNGFTYQDADSEKTFSSFSLFIAGGFAILGCGFLEWLVWLANPLYITSFIFLLNGSKKAALCGITAVVAGVSFLFWKEVLISESGRMDPIIAFESGYYLWVCSMLILLSGVLLLPEESVL